MSTAVAVRLSEDLVTEVRRIARRRATSFSSVIQAFTEEGVRASLVPGIVFRDGPSGRRATVAGSLDVWEVIETAKAAGAWTTEGLAAELGVPERVAAVALDYYSRYPQEIDDWIADNEAVAEQARAAWSRRLALV